MIIDYRWLLLAFTGLALLEPSETTDSNNCTTDNRLTNGPIITPCVSEIILQKGHNYSLTCKGVSQLRFIQQHVPEVVTSNFTIVNISTSIDEGEYRFQRTLHLYEVDQFAIGYYACSDETVHENTVNNIIEEPENTEHVSYIYVYVDGTSSIFAPMSQIVRSRCKKILIECRPSTPDVKVNLTSQHNQKSQNKTPKYSSKIGFILKKCDNFAYTCEGQRGNITENKRIRINVKDPLKPVIGALTTATARRFAEGENFSLTCTVNMTFQPAQIVNLAWILPNGLNMSDENIDETSNEKNSTDIFSTITVYNASKKHAGKYICVSWNTCNHVDSKAVLKEYVSEPFLNLTLKNRLGLIRQSETRIQVELNAYPEAVLEVLRDGIKLYTDNTDKYLLTNIISSNNVQLIIYNLSVADIANYTFVARNNKFNKNVTYPLELAVHPKVSLDKNNMKCVKGMVTSFRCDVSGYPLPTVKWEFINDTYAKELKSIREVESSLYNKTSFLDITDCHKGNITCIAIDKTKKKKEASAMRKLFVYEIYDGFGIYNKTENEKKWFLENDPFSLRCLASKHDFKNVTWDIEDSRDIDLNWNSTEFSIVAELKINKITLDHIGTYTCVGTKIDESKVDDIIQINVLKLQSPFIYDQDDVEDEVFRFDDKYLNCTVKGAPLPQIEWYKDGKRIDANFDNVKMYQEPLDLTTINATIFINKIQPNNTGKWECVAKGRGSIQKKSFTLNLKVDEHGTKSFVNFGIAIAVIMLVLIILIVYLVVKIKKEKQFRKELAAAGLLYFREGVINSLNPELGIDEQAELLPYDEKFEYPRDSLVLGIQLGAGAFGIVYKAEARGIIDAEETTTVAVKTVKKTADNMYIKALASELKIMVHLGKHINIVNLLGACTKNVGKRELYVIVEYCKYGNIHNYMQRHREVFIDQLDSGNKDKLGKVNRAYTTTSTGSSGMNSEYFGANNTQDTDHTFVNTANTTVRKNSPNNQPMEEVKASEGYVQPEWRSNYVSDYSYDGRSPRPLSSRDLLAWAFQIARGMEYLASRKVLHGDLAARNILLADDNVVKICDFGLAKSIYKNDEYQTKANCLLPVKWLAIECMTDRIFSTQSDVWSFGIVLWEMFSLAKTPYPNIHPSSLLQFLSEGHRLDKPAYADERLYDVMKKCWEAKAPLRPSFSQLQELLGTFLEDNVRNHYVDLNNTCMEKNVKVGTQEDYLDMMCAPDYNNLVTPSPHHIYINADAQKSFFPPTPVKVDDEGYLQMSPTNPGVFSPRNPNSEFDFDPRKFNAKTSDAGSCGSELTPMLTLNNLPARSGSESDHEGNAPYLNVCTPIEEVDEVFAPSFNETKNAKNMQQSAVTNPTYITFDNIEEKPKNINNYVNMPNGLVK